MTFTITDSKALKSQERKKQLKKKVWISLFVFLSLFIPSTMMTEVDVYGVTVPTNLAIILMVVSLVPMIYFLIVAIKFAKLNRTTCKKCHIDIKDSYGYEWVVTREYDEHIKNGDNPYTNSYAVVSFKTQCGECDHKKSYDKKFMTYNGKTRSHYNLNHKIDEYCTKRYGI